MKLKLCGNHSLDDLKVSINSTADYIGVVFAESKRKVSIEQLTTWLLSISLNPSQQLVAIVVNETIEKLKTLTKELPINVIQCHGNESPQYLTSLKNEVNIPVWKAIHHHENAVLTMKEYKGIADGYVIDAKVKGAWGGSGEQFSWEYVPSYIKEAKRQGVQCLIAGGITPNNVEQLVKYNPDGIDLSSGIELEGQKNKVKVNLLEERLNKYEHSSSR